MRNLHCRLIFAFVVSSLIIFLAGCGISVRPRSYDALPEDDAYYEESGHGSYYNVVPEPRNYYHHDPGYDPWTMSTYYQYYSGPPRADRSSDGSNVSSVQSGNNRPAVKVRDSASVQDSRAPSNQRTSLRRDTTATRKRRNTQSESSSSSVTRQRTRRDVRRGTDQTSQKRRSVSESRSREKKERTRTNSQKTNREPAKSGSEEEDKEKEKAQD